MLDPANTAVVFQVGCDPLTQINMRENALGLKPVFTCVGPYTWRLNRAPSSWPNLSAEVNATGHLRLPSASQAFFQSRPTVLLDTPNATAISEILQP